MDESLSNGGVVLLDNTQPGNLSATGGVGTRLESAKLRISPDLNGASIDFIGLVVNEMFFELSEFGSVGRVEMQLGATWQI